MNAEGPFMAGIARWCFAHRFIVLVLWLCALIALGAGQAAAGTR
jgi:RND superfamily putative drug exporter